MHLNEIIRYPLKSCRGESLERAVIDTLGIEADRRLILAETDGRFITARTEPLLLNLEVTPEEQGWSAQHPKLGSCHIDPEPQHAAEVGIWGRTVRAPRLSGAEEWFSQLLGRPVQLLVNQQALDRAEKRYPWGPIFSDGYPLLLCNLASLDAVNLATGELFEMRRFRPNLVIDAELPWAEDGWDYIEIGDTLLKREKPCERCVLITRDPETGEKHATQEPLRTLAQLHQGPAGEVLFGQNFSVARCGSVAVGDPVRLC